MIVPAILATMAAAGEPVILCTQCHSDVRVQAERSIHSIEEVPCVSCHGGDRQGNSVATAHRGDFRGKIPRREVPALCASCHSDAERMSHYNLSTDQYALYQTSAHGRALAGGDDRVAVCTDCHGVHEILSSADARSGTFPVNVPETCARCHSDADLIRDYDLPGDPYADFLAGQHGVAFAERKDASAPVCTRCHGAHGAAPPGVGDVDRVCGQCHSTIRAYFLESPHRSAMEQKGWAECSSCHGYHLIAKTNVEMLDRNCLACHGRSSREVKLGEQLKTIYTNASDDLEAARALVDSAKQIPLYVEDYEARLQEGRTSLLESLTAMHSVDLAAVEPLTERARSIGKEVQSDVRGKLEGRKWRRVGLGIFWFYLLVTVAILVRFRRRAMRSVGRE